MKMFYFDWMISVYYFGINIFYWYD